MMEKTTEVCDIALSWKLLQSGLGSKMHSCSHPVTKMKSCNSRDSLKTYPELFTFYFFFQLERQSEKFKHRLFIPGVSLSILSEGSCAISGGLTELWAEFPRWVSMFGSVVCHWNPPAVHAWEWEQSGYALPWPGSRSRFSKAGECKLWPSGDLSSRALALTNTCSAPLGGAPGLSRPTSLNCKFRSSD